MEMDHTTPELICSKIISCCDLPTRGILRQVSFHWNDSIESGGFLHFRLDQSNDTSVTFLSRIENKTRATVSFAKNWKKTCKLLGTNMKKLRIQCALTDNVPRYLQKYCPHLTSLDLDGGTLYLSNFGTNALEIGNVLSLGYLKYLRLGSDIAVQSQFHDVGRTTMEENIAGNMTYLLKALTNSPLQEFEVMDYVTNTSRDSREERMQMQGGSETGFWEDDLLINFVSRHSNTLKKLKLTCSGSRSTYTNNIDSVAKNNLPFPKGLTELTLRFRENEGIFMNSSYDFNSPNTYYWTRLLLAQFSLRKLDLCSFADFSKSVFREIVAHNMDTLEDVDCCGLSLVGAEELEAGKGTYAIADTCLELCKNLISLKLGLGCLYTSFDSMLHKIPTENLTELSIMCTRVPLTELENIIGMKKLKKLELIGVAFSAPHLAGNYADYSGILHTKERILRLDALKRILRMRSLDFINISGFQDPPSAFYCEEFVNFCNALDPVSTLAQGQEWSFDTLYKILSIRVTLKVVVKM